MQAAAAAGSWAGLAWFWLGGEPGWWVGGEGLGAWESYLQSGKATYSQAKLPTVRQSYLLSGKAAYCQASKGPLSGKAKTVRQAPNRSIDLHPTSAHFAPNRSTDLHPTSAYMHPGVSAYMHPKSAYIYMHLIPHTY